MKTFRLVLIFLLGSVVFISSCNKEEEDEAGVPMNKTFITGFAYADLDVTQPGDEFVPAGTKIIAIIQTEELFLTPDPNTTYPLKYYETTVGTDGKYSFSIDIGSNPIQVAITGNDFWYERQISPTLTELAVFKMAPLNPGYFFPRLTRILDVKYQPF